MWSCYKQAQQCASALVIIYETNLCFMLYKNIQSFIISHKELRSYTACIFRWIFCHSCLLFIITWSFIYHIVFGIMWETKCCLVFRTGIVKLWKIFSKAIRMKKGLFCMFEPSWWWLLLPKPTNVICSKTNSAVKC